MWTSTLSRTRGLPELVTAAALRRAGVDVDVARRACAASAWTQVLPGAWLRSGRAPRPWDRHAAALALLGPAAALTGAAACEVLGLRDVPLEDRTSVLVPAHVQRSLGPQVRLLRTGHPPTTYEVEGLRVAEPLRAVLDAARTAARLQDARALVLAAVADGWVSTADLRAGLELGPRRGSALCRRALEDAEHGAASAPEAEVADAVRGPLRRAGLAGPLLNHAVWLGGRLLGVADGWVPGLGLGWEVDSLRHHGGSSGLDRTLARHAVFERSRLELLHVTPARFRRDPDAFVQELLGRAAHRATLNPSEPTGLEVLASGVRPRTR